MLDRPHLDEALKPLTIWRGTGSSNSFRSSGESMQTRSAFVGLIPIASAFGPNFPLNTVFRVAPLPNIGNTGRRRNIAKSGVRNPSPGPNITVGRTNLAEGNASRTA